MATAPTTISETVAREAEDIESRRVALMDSAKAQVDAANANLLNGQPLTPDYRVAGMSPDQLNALSLGRQGIGSYLPYMTNATNNMQMAGNNVQQGVNTLLGADTRGQFTAAQAAMNRAATPIAGMGQAAQLATQGVGLIGQGSADIDTAQANLAANSQANLGASQNYLNQSVGAMNQAQPNYGLAQNIVGRGLGQSDLAAAQAQAAANQGGLGRALIPIKQGQHRAKQLHNRRVLGKGLALYKQERPKARRRLIRRVLGKALMFYKQEQHKD